MIRQWLRKLSASIFGGAFIIGLASIGSRLMGLVRDNLLAKYFGAGAELDMYNAAFKVPDFLFNIIVLGALSASFIPVFIQQRDRGEQAVWRLTSTVMNYLVATLLLCVGIGLVAAPLITQWLFAERPIEQYLQTVQLMRIMLLSVVFFGVSNIFSGVLNSYRKFLMYALAPILYNVGIIFGIVVLYPRYQLAGLAYGVVLGAVLHCVVQLPAVLRTGFQYIWSWRLHTPGVSTILKQMPARALALGVAQVNAIIITAYALRLDGGSLTIWQWADNLQNVPINVFGVSLALSAFPVFSQAFAENDVIKFKNIFSQNFRRLLFVIIPVSVAVLLLRAQFVRLILGSFGKGEFGWDDTIMTAQVLGIFAVVMFAQAAIPMLVRSFFAHHDTTTTVVISILSVIVNTSLAWVLSDNFGIFGLAAAFAFSSLVQMLSLLLILRIKFGDLEDTAIIRSLWRIVLAAIAMGAVIQGMKYFIAPLVDMRTVFGLTMQTVGSLGTGVFIYVFIAYMARFPEIDIIRGYLHKLKAAL